jgi:transcriptional regulator with XRE-family HTH domain
MKRSVRQLSPSYGPINNAKDLGAIIRRFRKSHQLTLEKVSGITNIGMRFLSELERGKETAELGKALAIINKLGLEVIIQPRGYNQPIS